MIFVSTTQGEEPRRARGKTARYVIALALLVAYLIFGVFFYRECAVTTGTASSNGSVCEPASLSSATVVLAVLLLVALVWPEVAEFSVLGVSLKRRVAEAERAAETAVHESERATATTFSLQAQLNQVVATYSSATASADNHTNIFLDPTWTQERAAQLKRAFVDVGDDVQSLAPTETQQSDAELSIQLLREYQVLAARLGLARTRAVGRPSTPVRELYDTRRWFTTDYQPQVNSVREARNSVAHAERLSRQELFEAIQLVRFLDDRLSEAFAQHGVDEGAEITSPE